MFNSNALVRLAERTEYEAWFLEAVYTIAEQDLFPSWPDAVVYRGTVIHDKHFTAASGAIRVSSSKNNIGKRNGRGTLTHSGAP
jgi:hypothetical protein